jgi:Zn-finger nucleic acid-binding protein
VNPRCPACSGKTTVERWTDVSGLKCAQCGGHYVRAAALLRFFSVNKLERRFARLVETVRAAPPSPRPLRCPECDEASFRVLRATGAEIDGCAICTGLFFDANEATGYFRRTRPTHPSPENSADKGFDFAANTATADVTNIAILSLLP